MAHSKDYKSGYDAAIEAIKKKLQDMQNGNNDMKNQGSGDGNQQDNGMISPEEAVGGQKRPNQQGQSGGSASGSKSRTSKNDQNQGIVRPEDCCPPSSSRLSEVPGRAGGMIDMGEGEQIAKQEGYKPEGGNATAIERDWKDAALRETNKHKGDLPGNLVATIEGLYKTAQDWKKELRKIVGYSISPDDKRSAYANKNVLVSQDRLARTEKDQYDNMDYMMAWIDSSGSMSDDQLKQCLTEVHAVALAKKPMKLVVIQCDTKIQWIKEYRSLEEMKRDIPKQQVHGRGGTELKPCWDLLRNDPKYKRISPELVMIFTDGGLTQYKRDARTMRNLCWVILDNPSWQLQYKDINTKVVHIRTNDIK